MNRYAFFFLTVTMVISFTDMITAMNNYEGKSEAALIQPGSLKISEGFETWPPAGWTLSSPDAGAGWYRNSIAQNPLFGGGEFAATASSSSGGKTRNDQWMITPAIAVSEGDKLSFWMMVINALYYREKVEVLVSETGKNTADFTINLETLTFNGGNEAPWTFHLYDLAPFAGKTIYIAIREIQTDKTQFPVVQVDLFKVGKLPLTEGALTEITLPEYLAPGPSDVTGKILNLGTNPISSFDLEYKVDQQKTEKTTISGFSLSPGGEMKFSFGAGQYNATSGYHSIRMWISNISGLGNDEELRNDTLVKNFQVSSRAETNTPLFEEFTSSTCPPCAYYNTNFVNPFFAIHPNDLTLVKYQMNWPGTGDPYYNSDGGIRRVKYNCNAVPKLYAGGKASGLNSAETLISSFHAEINRKTYLSLNANHILNKTSKQISVDVTIKPFLSSGDFTLFTAVIEKETTGNARTNGETQFHHVMMKMIPDARGTALNLTDNMPVRVNLTGDLNNTKIEQFADLAVVVFVQNNKNNEVVQSAYSAEVTTSVHDILPENEPDAEVFPSPFRDRLNIRLNLTEPTLMNAVIISPEGRTVSIIYPEMKTPAGFLDLSWNGTGLNGKKVPQGLYILRIRTDKKEMTRKVVFDP